MLEERRTVLSAQVRQQVRDVRTDKDIDRGRGDRDEAMEFDQQGDVDLTIIQMRVSALDQVERALRRLGDGHYGECQECGDDIAEARLRALPFAVRCLHCEAAREGAALEERRRVAASQARQRDSSGQPSWVRALEGP